MCADLPDRPSFVPRTLLGPRTTLEFLDWNHLQFVSVDVAVDIADQQRRRIVEYDEMSDAVPGFLDANRR
jgi:hypothetical protein